jgi:hypothetical protein
MNGAEIAFDSKHCKKNNQTQRESENCTAYRLSRRGKKHQQHLPRVASVLTSKY